MGKNTRVRIAGLATGVALLAGTAATAGAQSPDRGFPIDAACVAGSVSMPDVLTTEAVGAGDAHFMRFAAQAGLAEVASSEVAQSRASLTETREFAARMVAEHSQQAGELQALAARFGVTLPTEPDPASQLDLADLNALSGDAFDLAYLEVQVDAHAVTLRAFKTEARHGKNACVRSWAASYVPILVDHLQEAKATLNAVSQPIGDDDTAAHRGSDDTGWTDDGNSPWDASQVTSTWNS